MEGLEEAEGDILGWAEVFLEAGIREQKAGLGPNDVTFLFYFHCCELPESFMNKVRNKVNNNNNNILDSSLLIWVVQNSQRLLPSACICAISTGDPVGL